MRLRPIRLRAACLAPLTVWLMLGIHAPAHAERANRDQPTRVESDTMNYDDSKQVNEFRGRVVLTQGTLTLRADRLIVRQDAQGFQSGEAQGQPAQFRQQRLNTDEWLEGQADALFYDGRAQTFTLIGHAQVRRLAGTQLQDEIMGARIVYNTRTEQLMVDGQPVPSNEGSSRGRVRVTIQPRPTSASSTPAGPSLRTAPPLP